MEFMFVSGDMELLVLTSSLLFVNHVLWNTEEIKRMVVYSKRLLIDNPVGGWWAISFAAFLASPILSNDGVCLLFVEPILDAFGQLPHSHTPTGLNQLVRLRLQREDAIYFLLTVVCSAHLGTVLTTIANWEAATVTANSSWLSSNWRFVLPSTVFSWLLSKSYIMFLNVAHIAVNTPLVLMKFIIKYSHEMDTILLDGRTR